MYIGGGGISIPGDPLAASFNGNFASLFAPGTLLQSVQTDLGLTYGGTPLATAGNTSTTALTLTGSLATVPVPIWAKATNSASVGAGATFNIYFDGTGTTPAMVGVTPAAGTPVPLTGAGTGLSLTWIAGTGVTNDSWKATCAGWADQASVPHNYTQGTLVAQPVVSTGLNGFPGVLFDGVGQFLACTLDLPAPGTTPTCALAVFRVVGFTANGSPYADGSGLAQIAFVEVTSGFARSQDGAAGPNVAYTVGTWMATRADFSNSVGDIHRFGSSQATGNAGNSDPPANRNIGGSTGLFANCEVLALLYLNQIPSSLAAFYAAVTAKYGATVNV